MTDFQTLPTIKELLLLASSQACITPLTNLLLTYSISGKTQQTIWASNYFRQSQQGLPSGPHGLATTSGEVSKIAK